MDVVEVLIAGGVDVNKTSDDGRGCGARPIHIAADAGFHEVVHVLLTAGADINAARIYQIRLMCIQTNK